MLIEADDLADLALVQQLQRQVKLRLFTDEQDADPGIAQDVAGLLQSIGRIDGHHDPAGGQDAQIGHGPLGHVA